MVDSVQIWPPGLRLTDAAGAVLSGGQVRFFDAGTTTPKAMYADKDLSISLGSIIYTRSDGLPVDSEGSTSTVTVYTGTSDYKFDVLDSDDVVVVPSKDNVRGALNTSSFLTSGSTSTFALPVLARTTDLNPVTTTHRGKLINCNPSGGDFTLTFDAATTLADNWTVFIANAASSGNVFLAFSQALSIAGTTVTRYVLQPGELIGIACDGTAFKAFHHDQPFIKPRTPAVITIVSRVSAAPVGPAAGARYIVSAAYSSFATGDIIEYNGSDYTKYTPPTNCGWIAYVQDEARFYSFQSTAWVIETATSSRPGTIKLATQALQEAFASADTAVMPSVQRHHPGHPKMWGYVTVSGGTPTISVSHNLTSITDTGLGILDVTIADDFSSANWCCLATAEQTNQGGEGGGVGCFINAKAAGTVTIIAEDGDEDGSVADRSDPTAWHFAGFGDLP